jgi:hypothetical protein
MPCKKRAVSASIKNGTMSGEGIKVKRPKLERQGVGTSMPLAVADSEDTKEVSRLFTNYHE